MGCKMIENNRYYAEFDPLQEISAAIDLLCGCNKSCTPTDVLRLLGYTECNELRTLIVVVAESRGYVVKKSGRGMKILDW